MPRHLAPLEVLFNGDLSVCWGERGAGGGRLWAWFASPGALRAGGQLSLFDG